MMKWFVIKITFLFSLALFMSYSLGESATRIPQSISLHESWPTVNESVINIQANLNTFRLILEDLETLADDGYRNEIDLVLNNQISKIDFSCSHL